jgi:hypothetical protein
MYMCVREEKTNSKRKVMDNIFVKVFFFLYM